MWTAWFRSALCLCVCVCVCDNIWISSDIKTVTIFNFEAAHFEQAAPATPLAPAPAFAATLPEYFQIQGSKKPNHLVDSPIAWLVEACVEVGLFTHKHASTYSDPEEAIARWPRDKVYTTKERFKTRGGITEAGFWPKVLLNYPQKSSGVFTDFGSEYFFQGLLCALLGKFEEVVGIEQDEESFKMSVELAKHMVKKAKTEKKFISNITLIRDDFLKNDAVPGIIARSNVVYANNVVFGPITNITLVEMWRNSLPAGAMIVLFDETAILGSGDQRISRFQDKLDWASKEHSFETKVSWQVYKTLSIHCWRILKQKI